MDKITLRPVPTKEDLGPIYLALAITTIVYLAVRPVNIFNNRIYHNS